MKTILGLMLTLILCTNVIASDKVFEAEPAYYDNDSRQKILTKEAEDAILFLEDYVQSKDREFIRFFSTYAVPEELREKTVLTLSFVCHSLTGPGKTLGGYTPIALQQADSFIPLQKVDGSDTLWWIDLRDYNWTQQSWENVANQDGYFVEPAIDHDVMGALRLMAGNAILRADWFIVSATDIMRQDDAGIKNNIYKELLYSQVETPTNIEEFRQTWGLDIDKATTLGNQFGALVITSNKVALDNRMLFGYRTDLGWLYESYDVKDDTGKRDYLENFPTYNGGPPPISDAGEVFASNHLHMQVYDLRDGEGNLVNFADPGVARHLSDVLGDARVKVANSCMDCHAIGPLPAENIAREYDSFLSIKVPEKKNSLNINRAFLDNRFEDSVLEFQSLFALAMLKVNGLSPVDNIKNYLEVVKWYNTPLTVEQAAIECGLTPEEYVEAFNKTSEVNLIARVPGRIKLMLHPTKPIAIPRNAWENPGRDGIPGLFQQSIIAVYGLTTIEKEETIIEDVDEIEVVKPIVLSKDNEYVTTRANVGVYQGNEKVGVIKKMGESVELLSEKFVTNPTGTNYIFIKYGAFRGLIQEDHLKIK